MATRGVMPNEAAVSADTVAICMRKGGPAAVNLCPNHCTRRLQHLLPSKAAAAKPPNQRCKLTCKLICKQHRCPDLIL